LMIVVFLAVTVSLAGDPKPLTQAESKALLFDLGGLANLGAGNYGGGIGAKYYLAQNVALRLSLGFTTSTQTTKNTESPLPANRLGESGLTSTTFTLGPAITYNIVVSSAVAAYVGGMLSYSSTRDRREGNNAGLGVGFDSGEAYRQSTTSWGFAGILGVEWFPWESISLSGEYRLGYNHTSSEFESNTPAVSVTTEGPSTSGLGLGSANSAALTLAVFF